MVVEAPQTIDLNTLGSQLTNLADQQNTGQLVALAASFVSTITAGGAQQSAQQKALQQALTDQVRNI